MLRLINICGTSGKAYTVNCMYMIPMSKGNRFCLSCPNRLGLSLMDFIHSCIIYVLGSVLCNPRPIRHHHRPGECTLWPGVGFGWQWVSKEGAQHVLVDYRPVSWDDIKSRLAVLCWPWLGVTEIFRKDRCDTSVHSFD